MSNYIKIYAFIFLIFSANNVFANDESVTGGIMDIFGGAEKIIKGTVGIILDGTIDNPLGIKDGNPKVSATKISGNCINSQATFTYSDGSKYNGSCVNESREGSGTQTWKEGHIYKGDWSNNKRSGEGRMSISNYGIYVGEFVNDMMQGKGTYTMATGEQYVGQFNKDKRDGFGTNYFVGGDIYEGKWKNDNTHGQGTYTYATGAKYTGQFENNFKTGIGTYYHINGDVYLGEFKNDKRHGKGIYTKANGEKIAGIFKNDQITELANITEDMFGIVDNNVTSSTNKENNTSSTNNENNTSSTNKNSNNQSSPKTTTNTGYTDEIFKMPEISLSQEFINNFWKFILIILPILSYLILIYFSAKKTYTVFANAGDIMSTLLAFILPVLVIWFMTYIEISTGFDMTAFIVGTIIFLIWSSAIIKVSIKRNKDQKMGIIIGVTKIFASLVILVFSLGLFNAIFGNKDGKNSSGGGNLAMLLLVTSVLYFFIKLLITGDKSKNPELTEKPS